MLAWLALLAGLPALRADVEADRCTTIVVGRGAGRDGPMLTHTADCSSCYFRVNKVPAGEWAPGEERPLFEYRGEYPATVTATRGETWHPANLEGSPAQLAAWGRESVLTGHVPQVSRTLGLLEAGYGIMNEAGVAIGESTCAARFTAKPTSAGGSARIEVREMSRIALERCTTARDAVRCGGLAFSPYCSSPPQNDGRPGGATRVLRCRLERRRRISRRSRGGADGDRLHRGLGLPRARRRYGNLGDLGMREGADADIA